MLLNADFLSARLEDLNMSQAELARRISASPVTVTHWINGNPVKDDRVAAICDVLDCQPADLNAGLAAYRAHAAVRSSDA